MTDTNAMDGGIYAWMASVRASMANDPCRLLFEDQVQTHAFIFLDDYLDHILAGPKQGPIIDLVKTPGRKKNVPRRTRAATAASAKVKTPTFFSLDEDNSTQSVVPVNNFHKALLEAKETSIRSARDALPTSSSLPESQAGRTELSVIAEGDESPERSRITIPPLSTIATIQEEFQIIPQREADNYSATETNLEATRYPGGPIPDTRPSSVDAHHTVEQFPSLEIRAGNYTEPLPSGGTAINSPRHLERNAFTAPLPVVPVSNPIPMPHTISVPLNDTSPKRLAHKSSNAGFPILPAPSPLRKSMKLAKETLAGPAPPTTAPAPAPLGKRTSWLMKAREAKAMEGTGPLPGTSVATTSVTFPPSSTAVKRKSGGMFDALPSTSDRDKDQRKPKLPRPTVEDVAPLSETMPADHSEYHPMDVDEQVMRMNSAEEGCIDLFKRTVEGLGARTSKSVNKSLGGSVVAALAEARAAAEARVAQRNQVDREPGDPEVLRSNGQPGQETFEARLRPNVQSSPDPVSQVEGAERRLSLSDLGPDIAQLDKPELPIIGLEMDVRSRFNGSDESISTTPPDSPPPKGISNFVKPAGPVFNKPPPVFMPPASKLVSGNSKEFSFDGPSGKLAPPIALSLGIPVRLVSPNTFAPVLQATSQLSPQTSIPFNPSFHKPDVAPIFPEDNGHTIDSQPGNLQHAAGTVVGDDDDSWPLEEKLAAAEPGWRPFDFSNVDKEDTWSSLPTESQGPTRRLTTDKNEDGSPVSDDAMVDVEINDEEIGKEQEISDAKRSMEVETRKIGPDHVQPPTRAASQTSMASGASSSQVQVGILSQATKLVHTMLGGGKKAKLELKSLQSKKQKDDVDKKTQRPKETEARRQIAIAKKEEDGEKRNKDERKREREENTDRRLLKPSVSTKKVDDDSVKKPKLAPETEKKLEIKKLPSKDKKDLVPPPKVAATPVTKVAAQRGAKANTAALVSSAAYNTTQSVPSAKSFKVAASSLKGKAKAMPQEGDMGEKLPSTMVQSQMAARAKAQMQAAKVSTPEVPSESIELPDINSEYSDSDDEDRVRTFDPPDWAQSPELRQALEIQSTVNPDDVFGAIRPIRMDEMFRSRPSRFRARTSSANWTGTDMLTVEEIREYERRMGFQPSQAS